MNGKITNILEARDRKDLSEISTEDMFIAAVIRRIVADNQERSTMLDRVIAALEPHAREGEKADDPGVWEKMRTLASSLIEAGFEAGEFPCPMCGAEYVDSDILCHGKGDCPVTVGG